MSKKCCCFEIAGDNTDCPIHRPTERRRYLPIEKPSFDNNPLVDIIMVVVGILFLILCILFMR